MLIVLEGLDGAGKSTQVGLLKDYLSKVCTDLEYIHFPRYDAPVYGDLISRFLRGEFGAVDQVHPQLVALLFAEDRHLAAPVIKAALDRGATVLLDRYVCSNIAYQCAKLSSEDEAEALRKWIYDTEYGVFGIPKPDLNLFLNVPMDFVQHSLATAREGDERSYLAGAQDIHEADIEFQKKVRRMYLIQSQADPSLVSVDCSDTEGKMLPPDSIFERIKREVDKVIL